MDGMMITFEPIKATEWLRSPSEDKPGLTVAAALDVDDESGFSFDSQSDEFMTRVDELVGTASSNGLFGRCLIGVWPVRGSDGSCTGGLVTVDVEGQHRSVFIRLASLHFDSRDLIVDRTATGEAAAVSVLSAVAATARTMVNELADFVRAEQRRPSWVMSSPVPAFTDPAQPAQGACAVCGLDIETTGDGVFRDRGGNLTCATGGAAKWDSDGNPIALPDTPHVLNEV